MSKQLLHLDGKDYVVIEREEYDRLATLAKAGELPALPDADADGEYPAVEYARASLARKIIRKRSELGLTQKQAAERAGLPVETLCRIETGKQTPRATSVDKIEAALTPKAKRSAKKADHGTSK
jgi:DNA-binding XRE family transcriptional regulator